MAKPTESGAGQRRPDAWITGGLVYFAAALLLGFLLGTLRTLVMIPLVGEVVAVLLELPIILALTWLCCRQIIGRFGIAPRWQDRFQMGALALVILLTVEFLMFVYLFDNAPGSFLTRPGDLLGLAGQGIYALFPTLQLFIKKRL
ncbi:MAG: hypothetical protein ACFHX7_25105 [Pseudomonadota bacterium]